ncbi:ATP-binding protein [Phaeobacter sp. QD34_3]|uniref:hybrid sensor histidine kinase/response regulator n=1 Tax=unclassified Phaeobacter TaxID=2621772 RepID=UPI00237F4535|nr:MULTISPECIES: ATP-binding protein [unclassified Phaeobacter]MDE4131479.1 ATP-binding protein [Phaeobacter sp. QD34_3]MDE4135432.1 ATP-binding protein [Phaeobacter sp. QD34_24]
MTQETEWRFPLASRWVLAAALIVLPLLAVQSVRLGHQVLLRLEGLSTAATDNMQWVMSQAEVEHLKLAAAVNAAKAPEDLRLLRRQFDIYYSRIATFLESPLFQDLRESEAGGVLLGGLSARLDRLAELIDVSDQQLLQNMLQVQGELAHNGEEVRELALFGVVIQVEGTEAKRLQLFSILSQLAWVILGLFVALAITALMLARMYRRGQSLAEERRRAASRMEAMISSSLDAILVVDQEDRIQAFNGAAESIFGYSRAEAIGQKMQNLIIPPHLREAHARGMARFLKTGENRVIGAGRVQLDGMRKTGEIFPVELSLSLSQTGQDMVFVSFLRDISDRMAAEEELRTARDDALAGERAKANLLTVMSHEMRTPLTGVLGAIDLLEDTDPTSEQARYLQAMRVSGELLLHHVNDVLQLSRLEAGVDPEKMRVFDMQELAEGLLESQQATALSRGIDLSLHCSLGPSPMVAGRPRAIQQALLNLIANALKFTKEGAVSVDIQRQADTDQVEFQVADTGPGIPEEDQQRIFEDFTMLDASYRRGNEGTGLGLAITRRIVLAMDGEITCESEVGEGSLFTISMPLPIASAQMEQDDAATKQQSGYNAILVVEDNDINRLLLEQMLVQQGQEVTTAAGGLQAVEAARDGSFDLILMDISMPEVDGIEAIRRIREGKLAEGTDIVALTAHAAPEDHARILEAGFAEVITKPISKRELADLIARRAGRTPVLAEDNQQENIVQFFDALGPERARGFLVTFCQDVERLRADLAASSELTSALRQEAHRLAGSAAVLGLTRFRAMMLEIEMAEGDQVVDPQLLDEIWSEAESFLSVHMCA